VSAHDRFQEMLARRRELSADEEQKLETHLNACSDCAARAEAFAAQSAALRTIPQEPVPGALRARVLAATRERQVLGRRRLHLFPALSASAAALLVAAVSVFAWSHRPQAGNQAVIPPASTPRATSQATPHATSSHQVSGHHHTPAKKGKATFHGGTPSQSRAPGPSFTVAGGPVPTHPPGPLQNSGSAASSFPTASTVTSALLGRHPVSARPARPAATAVSPPQIAVGPPNPTAAPRPPSAPVAPPGTPSPVKSGVPTATAPATPGTPMAAASLPATPTPTAPATIPAPLLNATP
jgi:hypothetical protein